ncbi:XopX family type III secretion system effector [Xanthomonas dyei]|uniref:XopX family type III secretion system effector n=1 Tax=Xanthomonas dyei TaxID=743699 RepID=UPI002260C43B|nr:XopX family type III secretion system effector [Xanthomonas dyei]
MEIRNTPVTTPSSSAPASDHPPNDANDPAARPSASPATTPIDPALTALAPLQRTNTPSRTRQSAAPTDAPSLRARAQSALTRGAQQVSATASSAASNLWSLVDLRSMLQIHADDPAFLRVVRSLGSESGGPASLEMCRQSVSELRDVVADRENGLENRLRQQLLGDIKAVEDALHPLEHGTPALGRTLKSLANLVNLWPLAVPSPLLGNQAKTFAYSIAAATRGVMTLSASALRPTADGLPFPLMGGQLGRDANEMHLYSILLNGMFLGTELPKKFGNPSTRHQAEAVENNLGFAAAASAACAALVLTPFFWHSINALGNRLYQRASHMGANLAQRAGLPAHAERMRTALTPGQITTQLRTQLDEIGQAILSGRDAFQQARRDFSGQEDGGELTRTLNAQCTHLLETLDRCSKRLSAALHADQDQPAAIPRQIDNHDFSSKLTLALLGGGVTGLTVYLIQPDRIGTVDLIADSIVVTTAMLQSTFNANANRQDAMERFKAMCSSSMVMALALGAEKLSKTFADKSLIEASSASPYYAGAIMSLMAVTMPGPMARGSELAMNWGGRQITRGRQQIMRMFKGPDGTPLATGLPGTQQELQERTRSTLAYFLSLKQEDQQAYGQLVAEAALQAVQDAGATAPTRPSSVVITEIEEGSEGAEPPVAPTAADGTAGPSTIQTATTGVKGGVDGATESEIDDHAGGSATPTSTEHTVAPEAGTDPHASASSSSPVH